MFRKKLSNHLLQADIVFFWFLFLLVWVAVFNWNHQNCKFGCSLRMTITSLIQMCSCLNVLRLTNIMLQEIFPLFYLSFLVAKVNMLVGLVAQQRHGQICPTKTEDFAFLLLYISLFFFLFGWLTINGGFNSPVTRNTLTIWMFLRDRKSVV